MEQRIDVLSSILQGRSRINHLIAATNLNWVVITKHLAWLESQGLITITRERTRKVYGLTEFGTFLAKSWREVYLPYLVAPGEEVSTEPSSFADPPVLRRSNPGDRPL